MKCFQKLAEGIPTAPIVNAVLRAKWLWNQNTLRTATEGSPHAAVDDIWLRFQHNATLPGVLEELECEDWPAMTHLGMVRPIIWDLARLVEAERIGRVLITRLEPGLSIAPHRDCGGYAEYYTRFHVALSSLPGVVFKAGGEQVGMLSGEVWWVDVSAEHEVVNNSADDRLTMIVDLKTRR